MAFRQPRVPLLRDDAQLTAYIRELILFLRDFCMETWTAVTRQEEEMRKLRSEMQALAAQDEQT